MPLELVLGILALVVAVAALVVALAIWSRQERARETQAALAAPVGRPGGEQLAVVVNPSKDGATEVVETVRRLCAEAALPEPLILETTVEDPGGGQARAALAAGADVVLAAGGDGTVRAVAEAMVGTGRPMGLVPAGTGNLLARNLDIPLTSAEEALAVVLAGNQRAIDVGWARVLEYADEGERDTDGRDDDGPPDGDETDGGGMTGGGAARDGQPHIFLVIAGLGFDAAMVADADDTLKARVGWMAYFLAGVRHLHGRRMRASIRLDDEPPVGARLRSVMVGNCGRLPGGITLLPDAIVDDGELDVAAIDTRGGLAGWAQLFGEVVMQGFGVRTELPAKIGRIDHARATRVWIRVEGGEQAQVDGDSLGRAVELETWVEPGALLVRAP
jgi:diacylglycerol kinase (ATP)